MSAVELPCCLALQSKKANGKYLRYVHDDGDEAFKLLQLNGDDAINPYTRFEVEPSLMHEGLVHIRCCYNHKYWVARRRGDDGSRWVFADADEPEEDLTKPSCTLIKPVVTTVGVEDDPESMTVRFLHPEQQQHGSGKYARMLFNSSSTCMVVEADDVVKTEQQQQQENDDDAAAAFAVVNLATRRKVLPKHVVFKGPNGLYLCARVVMRYNHLQFASNDIGDPTARNEIITLNNGNIRVTNNHYGRLWRVSHNWILGDGATTLQNNDVTFRVIQLDDFIALRNMRVNLFCSSLTEDGKTNCLKAEDSTITRRARIVLEEAVLSREIYNINYQLRNARIYDTKVLTVLTTAVGNDTSAENTKRLRLSYSEEETSTWDSTVELKLSYTATIRAGLPKILGGQVTYSAEFSGTYNWGKTVEKTTKHEAEYEVTVPPNTLVTVRLIATQGTCDVPFTYRQRDILVDGRVIDESKDDGLYTGINSYDIKFETEEERLPARKKKA